MWRNERWAVVAGLYLTLAFGSRVALAGFEANLIVNSGAEAGTGSASGFDVLSVPGWTTIGSFTVVQYGAPLVGHLARPLP